jgi:hypothetical protein
VTASTFANAGDYNSKDLRYYPNADDTLVTHYMSDTPTGPVVTYEFATEPQQFGGYLSAVTPYQHWYHVEWWFHATSDTSGYVKLVIDGENVGNWTGLKTIYGSHTMNAWRIGQVSGDNTQGGSNLTDQLYIDNTQAHVFISDRSNITNWLTYGSTAHNEIQVPSSWTDTSVRITLNQGTLPSNQTLYLYVADANGQVNTPGFPIVIGGGGGGGGGNTLTPPGNLEATPIPQ